MKLARLYVGTVAAAVLVPTVVAGQGSEPDGCRLLCTPELKIEPQVSFGPIFSRPVVEELVDGQAVRRTRPDTEAAFETVLAIGIPTEIPRVEFTLETIFVPFEESDNDIEFELELNLIVLDDEDTGGWVGSHFDIVDKFSPAERPGDTSRYTHKLNFEWDTGVRIFNWLPPGNWLKNLEIEGSLDYVATGLPKAGDVIDGVRFIEDESPWSFSLVFVFPLAPLSP